MNRALVLNSTTKMDSRMSLWRRWTLATALGEVIGFVAPAIAGAGVTAVGLDASSAYVLLLAAGFIEGSALGTAQGWALRSALPRLPVRRFALATGAAAVLAYAIGMLPSTLGERLAEQPPSVVIGGAILGGLVLLTSIGGAQWLVLRGSGYGWPWWIATTAAAWLAGLLAFMAVSTPLWRPSQPLPLTIAVGILGALAMAVIVAGLTGLAALRLVRRVT